VNEHNRLRNEREQARRQEIQDEAARLEEQQERRNQARHPRRQRQVYHEDQDDEEQPPRHERRHHHHQDDEQHFGKLKFTMPKFSGSTEPEEYLSWALKINKIFRLHNYNEEKKIAMASLEFQDYVLIWWEQLQARRHDKREPPIATWEEMKEQMRVRFVPAHYTRDLFKKLQVLKQGTKTVEEYFQEMEIAMI
jgi:hypothetical protein